MKKLDQYVRHGWQMKMDIERSATGVHYSIFLYGNPRKEDVLVGEGDTFGKILVDLEGGEKEFSPNKPASQGEKLLSELKVLLDLWNVKWYHRYRHYFFKKKGWISALIMPIIVVSTVIISTITGVALSQLWVVTASILTLTTIAWHIHEAWSNDWLYHSIAITNERLDELNKAVGGSFTIGCFKL